MKQQALEEFREYFDPFKASKPTLPRPLLRSRLSLPPATVLASSRNCPRTWSNVCLVLIGPGFLIRRASGTSMATKQTKF